MKISIQTGLLVLLMMLSARVWGQQEAMYTQYMFNGMALNPAYAGSHNAVSMTLLARDQWSGIEGAPSTQTFSIHSPLNNKQLAVGLNLIHDKITVFEQFGVNAAYAYRVKTKEGTLSMGMQVGFTQYKANLTDVTSQVSDDVFSQDVQEFLPNLGAGVYYYTERYYAGLSAPKLINHDLDGGIEELDSDAKQSRHYFLTGGYVFDLSRRVKLKPNVLIKVVEGAPIQMDLNASVLYQEIIWFGISWRSFADFDAILELQLTDQFKFGYSYDFANTTDLRRVNSGSHEIMLNYRFRFNKRKMDSPRFFGYF